jgi:hypothetical protein
MEKAFFKTGREILSYYRFKIETNPVDDTSQFIRVMRKGASSIFDNIYYHGSVVEYIRPKSVDNGNKFNSVNIKFKIEDGKSSDSTVQIFSGTKGYANVIKRFQVFYTVIYRIPQPDVYEVFLMKHDSSVDYLSKLKQGKLDHEINKLLGL